MIPEPPAEVAWGRPPFWPNTTGRGSPWRAGNWIGDPQLLGLAYRRWSLLLSRSPGISHTMFTSISLFWGLRKLFTVCRHSQAATRLEVICWTPLTSITPTQRPYSWRCADATRVSGWREPWGFLSALRRVSLCPAQSHFCAPF